MVLRREVTNFRLVISIKKGAASSVKTAALGSQHLYYIGSQSCTEIIVIDILKVQVVVVVMSDNREISYICMQLTWSDDTSFRASVKWSLEEQ